MKAKNILTSLMLVAVLSASTCTAFATDLEKVKLSDTAIQNIEANLIDEELKEGQEAYFGKFTGVVKSITASESVKGSKYVLVENEQGQQANIIVSQDTFILDNIAITEGSTITGYYQANVPMIMIYPPQYSAEVVVAQSKQTNVKVDLFDKNLLGSDKDLKLNISDETQVVSKDGTEYEGELFNRKLVVLYDFTTKSLPAQTTPNKIIVLSDEILPEQDGISVDEGLEMSLIINDQNITAPKTYMNGQKEMMVPIRAVAQALGYEVKWDGTLQSVTVGKDITITVGKDYYSNTKTQPLELGSAPELVNESVFVPLSFFTQVLGLKTAEVVKSNIIIK